MTPFPSLHTKLFPQLCSTCTYIEAHAYACTPHGRLAGDTILVLNCNDPTYLEGHDQRTPTPTCMHAHTVTNIHPLV